jgi:hypothetical protein
MFQMSITDRAVLSSNIYEARAHLGVCKHLSDEARAGRVAAKLMAAQELVNEAIGLLDDAGADADSQLQAAVNGGRL